ncbi:premnaspirodiene oxygenase-like [Phalaenopsis equestris]|uniref:premnaspirodiene oxygenase-like n=1 Tax=Phalaenopsis equestris TaxID=78828 RepID=UPI0009E53359|nr:premnaspirodiene oxygenase-like [Phalaenopsis equestris]
METPELSTTLPIITSILLILFIKKLWFQKNSSAYNLPPGPWKLPIIGSLHHLMGEQVHHRLRRLANTYGPLFHLKLGEVDLMVITSPELAAESMKSHDLSFASRPQFMGSKIILYNNGDIVFAPYGKLWAQLRKICTIELFSSKRVKHFRTIMDEEGNNLIEKIRAADGLTVNMTELLLSVANTTISRTTFGKECTHQHKIFSAVKDTFKYMSGFDLADLFPSYSFLGEINGMRRHLLKVHKVLDTVLDEVFEEHKTKSISNSINEPDEDLVDVLLRLKNTGELDASVTMDNLKGVVVDLILGGTETTSAIMEWAMAELVRHPEAMRKAQLEVRETFKGRTKLHESDITNLPYLTMVIKEILRVRPPAPILVPRYCSETVELGGYTIPAGSRLLINAWAIMRDPKFWKDPDTFIPERVEEDEQDFNASRFQYMPFGGGRRICPGATFGLVSIEIVLAKLLYHFDWTLPGGKRLEDLDMEESIGLALTRKNPLLLVASPHK